MTKGDKIKLIKPMGAFTNVGEICEVIDVSEDGLISFKFGGVHLGYMSRDELHKYFEKVVEEKMTITELYKWAIKNGVEDYELYASTYDEEGGLVWTGELKMHDIYVDKNKKRVEL